MTELAALNVRITGDSGDLTAAINSAKTQLGGLNTTIAQTQTSAGAMGGALGGLASRLSGARGQIQNVSFQLQDMAVQLGSGTAASVVFAQQGSQIASAFGPVGAVVGALAAVGIPLLALAFSSASEEAAKLKSAADAQAESLENLRAATESLRLERQMLTSGALLEDEQRQLNRIVELTKQRATLLAEIEKREVSIGGKSAYYANAEAKARREAAQAEIDSIDAELKSLNNERLKKTAVEATKAVQLEMQRIMNGLGNTNISGPWETVLGAIQTAINKAGEYAKASMQYSGRGGDPRQFGAMPGTSNTFDTQNFTMPDNVAGGVAGGGANAINSRLQTELEALQKGLMSQEQLQMESYTRQQETLKQALDARLLSQQDYANLMQQVDATHQAKMGSQMREGVATTIGALSQLFNKSKPIAIASALVNTWQGMTEALKLPFPKNIAAAATTLATGMNAVRNIKSTTSGGGGSTSGSIGGAGATAASAAAAPQQNMQTLNFTLANDSFGIGQNLVRQIAAQLNEAQRNGSTLVRATVS